MHTIEKLKIHRLIASAVLAIGVALMTMMIIVESEPGLLPLLLVVTGSAWLLAVRARMRALRG